LGKHAHPPVLWPAFQGGLPGTLLYQAHLADFDHEQAEAILEGVPHRSGLGFEHRGKGIEFGREGGHMVKSQRRGATDPPTY
jgi:hypothetical protein